MQEEPQNPNPTQEAELVIRNSVEQATDPLTLKSVVSLGLVRSVELHLGIATVEISTPVSPDLYPDLGNLIQNIESALMRTSLVREVKTRVDAMAPGEQADYLKALGHLDRDDKKSPFPPSTRVIAISSGKGGVGKSSVSVNLALAIHKLGHTVGILDADIYGFSVSSMFSDIGDALVLANTVVPPRVHGISLISAGLFAGSDQPVIWRGPMLHSALSQFLNNVAWLDPEYLVVDMPPGTGDIALSIAEMLPEAEFYVVTTPQVAAEQVAQRSALAARQLKMPVRGVIENMSYFRGDDGKKYELFGKGGGEILAESLKVKLLGQIPLIPMIREGGDMGEPVVASNPESEAGKAFFDLAEQIVALGPARRRREALKIS